MPEPWRGWLAPVLPESIVEEATLNWFDALGYTILHGPDLAPGEPDAERANYGDVVLLNRLRAVLVRINPTIPVEALEEAIRKVRGAGLDSPNLFENNRRFHKLLAEEELAFYDALEVNDNAVKMLGDETLRPIARELVEAVRRNVTTSPLDMAPLSQ